MEFISVDALLEQAQCTNAYFQIKSIVTGLPKIDAEPVEHGHWVTEKAISPFPICSNCNTVNACHSPYCGGCGAKMDEEQE